MDREPDPDKAFPDPVDFTRIRPLKTGSGSQLRGKKPGSDLREKTGSRSNLREKDRIQPFTYAAMGYRN